MFKKIDWKKMPPILVYDIETTPLRAWVWRLGKQVVTHKHLDTEYDFYNIICITTRWIGGPDHMKAVDLVWDQNTQNCAAIVEEFTFMCDKAALVVGKNSARFDDKHIRAQRLLRGMPGRPDLVEKMDDLEKWLRREFNLPSYALDYVSKQFNLGGKHKMELEDWVDIVTNGPKALQKLKKMVRYGNKDTLDTAKLIMYVITHVRSKYSAYLNGDVSVLKCKHCGSTNVIKNGVRHTAAGTTYQHYHCNNHNGHAGKKLLNSKTNLLK